MSTSYWPPVLEYRGLVPPDNYKTPADMHLEGCMEPVPKNSLCYLAEYEPKTDNMKKAKEYWSDINAYKKNPEERESLRSCCQEEIEKLRVKIWKRHIVNLSEGFLCNLYYCLNKEYKRTSVAAVVPSDFKRFSDYQRFEPESGADPKVLESIQNFPDYLKGIAFAKKYWLGEIEEAAVEDLNKHQDVFRFCRIFWYKHLELQRERDELSERAKECQEKMERTWKFRRKVILSFSALILGVATVALVSKVYKNFDNLRDFRFKK